MGYRTVVVGYDGSSNADRAVDAAADLVGPGGRVHVVTASHPESTARIADHLRQLP
jgi:nucleotide-binding universal stress UspA family protein